MDLLFQASTATDVRGFFPRFRFFLGQYRPCIIYIHIYIYILHLFFLQTYPNKIEKVVKTMSPLLIFMLLSGSLSPVRSIRESFCHLFFFVRGNGLRVLVYYMHYALRHKWTYQKKISSTQTSYCVYT